MKVNGRVEVKIHAFLNSALDRGESSVLHALGASSGERAPGIYRIWNSSLGRNIFFTTFFGIFSIYDLHIKMYKAVVSYVNIFLN
jgi:hypothetical protein